VFAAGAVRAGYGGLLTHAVAEGDLAAKAVAAQFGG
jgi:thioredoxin reductase